MDAVELARQAHDARRRARWGDAKRLLDSALEQATGSLKGRVLGERAWLSWLGGDLDCGLRQVEEALTLARGLDRARVLSWGSRLSIAAGDVATAEQWVEQARPLAGADGLLHEELRRRDALFLHLRGDLHGALALYRQGIEGYARLGDPHGANVCSVEAARLLRALGRLDEAEALFERALQGFEALDDPWWRAFAQGGLARIAAARGDVQRALSVHSERLALFEAVGDEVAVLRTLSDIGEARERLGDARGARTLYRRRLEAFTRSGHRRGQVAALHQLATVSLLLGELAEADAYARQQVQLCTQIGDRFGQAQAVAAQARIAASRGEYAIGLQAAEQAAATFEVLGHKRESAVLWLDAMDIQRRQLQWQAAETLCRAALTLFRALGDRREECLTVGRLGDLMLEAGAPERATLCFDDQLDLAEQMGAPGLVSLALQGKARSARVCGELDQAEALLLRAQSIEQELSRDTQCALLLFQLAEIDEARGRALQAAERFEAALDTFLSLGLTANLATTRRALADVLLLVDDDSTESARIDRAVSLYREAVSDHHERGEAIEAQAAELALFDLLADIGRPLQALEEAERALDEAQGEPYLEAGYHWSIGRVHQQLEDSERAAASMKEALRRYEALDSLVDLAAVSVDLAPLLYGPHPLEAIRLLDEAKALFERRGLASRAAQVDELKAYLGRVGDSG